MTSQLDSVALFCGSRSGSDPRFAAAAAELGRKLAERGIRLVYGGGRVGLMGIAADAALKAGGQVVGVIPRFLLEREVGHGGVTELVVVDSMHERKGAMAERADAFVALPGGVGTLEETFEAWTWVLLGLHAKPCALLDVDGYFDPLLEFLDRSVEQGFVDPAERAQLRVARSVEELLERIAEPATPMAPKWTERI